MSQSQAVDTMVTHTTSRSILYKLLAMGFRYPSQALFEAFQSGAFHAVVWDDLSQLPHLKSLALGWNELTGKLREDLQGVSVTDFEVQFVRTFDIGTPEPPCPPYEYAYRQGQEHAAVMVQLSTFYRCFGLRLNTGEGRRELHDHLCVELELMHFLTFKETQTRQEGNAELLHGYRRAQKDFLEHHLVGWLPSFANRLESGCPIPLYVHLAKFTTRLAALELAWLTSNLQGRSIADP